MSYYQEECDSSLNVVCSHCWGVVEVNCGCELPVRNFCKCSWDKASKEARAKNSFGGKDYGVIGYEKAK
jgi:hypothetical protein